MPAKRSAVLVSMSVVCLAGLGSCCSLSPEEQEVLRRADEFYELGNYLDARALYGQVADSAGALGCGAEHPIRVQEAACLLELGRYQEAGRILETVSAEALEPEVELKWRSYVGRVHLEHGRKAESDLLSVPEGSFLEANQHREKATSHYEEARHQFGSVLDRSPGAIDAAIGRAQALIREGALKNTNGPSLVKRELQALYDRGERDKRVVFFLGLAHVYSDGGGQLTEHSATLIETALRQDARESYSFHEAYQDVVLYLRARGALHPGALDSAFESRSQILPVVERLVRHLSEYAFARASSPIQTEPGLETVKAYLDGYNTWASAAEDARRRVALAWSEITERRGFFIDRYESALNYLSGVKDGHRDEEYERCRREVQQGFADSLLKWSHELFESGLLEQAEAYADKVRKYVYEFDPEGGKKRLAANEQLSRIESYKKLVHAAQEARRMILANKPKEAGVLLATYRKELGPLEVPFVQAKLADLERETEKSAEVGSIAQALSDGERAVRDGDRKGARRHFEEAYTLASASGLVVLKELAARQLARVLVELKDYDSALTYSHQISEVSGGLGPEEILLQAKCYFEKKLYPQACGRLDELQDTSAFSDEDKLLAGRAYLEAGRIDHALRFLESADRKHPGVQDGLRDCYAKLYETRLPQGRTPSAEERIELELLLKKLVAVDPANAKALHDLGFLLFERGVDPRTLRSERQKALVDAYACLSSLEAGGHLRLTAEERERYGRLKASIEDYMPLEPGNEWSYETKESGGKAALLVKVAGTPAASRFNVRVRLGEAEEEQIWLLGSDRVKKFLYERRSRRELPIRLRDPASFESSVCEYTIGNTLFTAKILETGVTCRTPAGDFEDCIRVRITEGDSGKASDHYFAPGVGEVMFEEGPYTYRLVQYKVAATEEKGAA